MDGPVKLIHVLVGNDEVEVEFAGFGENFDKGFGSKVLELINIEIEIGPLFGRLEDTVHGGQLDLGDKHGAQESGIVFAKFAGGEVGN